ncbi:MAG: SUMF1/EgtB/PvdO family nonheme iron enzyme [Rhodothermales bacterium]|nr:SUMF1/EgtB/PvdO family nonheme iron enzyme [Rhodothermales bacterium]MBO6780127.1 SUMF1/EgtB/PvdO family nonheme iron enzyme [Rhodothermales bacterium]
MSACAGSGVVPMGDGGSLDLQAGASEQVIIPGTEVTLDLVFVPTEGVVSLGDARVEISPFWMARHETTFEQFGVFRHVEQDSPVTATPQPMDVDAVARPSPPYEDPSAGMSRDGFPATGMTQWAALQYARWLSAKTGDFWRLPTEAEWEHACRLGGRRTLATDAWYLENSGEELHEVASRPADSLGLHDMLGNASEWMLDEYRNDVQAVWSEGPDPWARPARLHPRTVRGGAFDDGPGMLRCEARLESSLAWKARDPQIPKSFWWNTDSPFLGFRLVRPVVQPSAQAQAEFWALVLGD